MAELKTRATGGSVDEFLEAIPDEERRQDCKRLVKVMTKAVKAPAKMWGPSIVGFGDYRYKYGSGKENDWFFAGFSPRKKDLTLYIMGGVMDRPAMKRLGKFSTGKSCIYVKRLSDIDLGVLETLVVQTVKDLKASKARA
jgi:hypothetical protein